MVKVVRLNARCNLVVVFNKDGEVVEMTLEPSQRHT